eukprot:1991050-Rhodomonas_salina.2
MQSKLARRVEESGSLREWDAERKGERSSKRAEHETDSEVLCCKEEQDPGTLTLDLDRSAEVPRLDL